MTLLQSLRTASRALKVHWLRGTFGVGALIAILAVGARGRDIRLQFLAEAATLELAGGVLGLALGEFGAYALARIAGWPIVVDPDAALLAAALTAAVGILFGFYPAGRAASVSPIEALSHE